MRKIHFAALICCTWLAASQAFAANEPVPILLRFPSTAELNAPPASGLIGAWSFSSLNKQQAAKIAMFAEWLPDAALETKAREAFACAPIGAPDEACRTEAQLPKSEAELRALLESGTVQRGFIVTFQPIMIPAGLSLRVPVQEVEWDADKATVKTVRTFMVMYCARVPRAMEDQEGVSEQQLKEFWLSGSPSRLSTEVDKGIRESAVLLEELLPNVDAKGKIAQAWRGLPKIGPLEKAGRVRCRGMPCSAVRVYRDTPDGLWLTAAGGLPPDVGVALISLTADAAAFETNVWGITFAGY
jgi:hypothetical protein